MKENVLYPTIVGLLTIIVSYLIKIDNLMNELSNFYDHYPNLSLSILMGFLFVVIYFMIKTLIVLEKIRTDNKEFLDFFVEHKSHFEVTYNNNRRNFENQYKGLCEALSKELKKVNPNVNIDVKEIDVQQPNKELIDHKNERYEKAVERFKKHFNL